MTLSGLLTSAVILFMPLGQGDCDLMTGGYYVMETKEIYICTPLDEDVEFYKYHELGHYVWNTFMNTKQRNSYRVYYYKALTKGIGGFYRDYGTTNAEEDFSENFAIMIMNEKVESPLLKYRINYIRQLFKKL